MLGLAGLFGAVLEWKILDPVLRGDARTSVLPLLSRGEDTMGPPTDEPVENRLFPSVMPWGVVSMLSTPKWGTKGGRSAAAACDHGDAWFRVGSIDKGSIWDAFEDDGRMASDVD